MSGAPVFSVVIPAYNAEDSIGETIRSVLGQTFGDFEAIVVDDGSKDRTAEIAAGIAEEDSRVRVISKPNGGCASARNEGCRAARGEFVCLLDADDAYLPTYLAEQHRMIETYPGKDIYSCNGIRRFAGGREERVFRGPRFDEVRSFDLAQMIEADLVFVMAVFRKDLFERLGGFREDLRYSEDYDFWLRAFAAGATHVYNPTVLGIHVRNAGSKSSNLLEHAHAVRRILSELSETADLNDAEREAMRRSLHAIDMRIERVRLEERLRSGDFTSARSTYLRTRPAYIDQAKFWLGFGVIAVSPRLYARLLARR